MSQYVTKVRTSQGDKQIDYNALANLPTISNPNLLVNSDFRSPINQRGITKYEGMATKGYTIDRWCMGDNDFGRTVEVVSGGITITNPNSQYTGTFQQIFENTLPQDNYTLSVKVKSKTGGATMSCGGSNSTKKEINVGINTFTINSSTVNSFVILLATNSSITLEWAKLEVGTVATTFVPRIYAEEVALCKRFYQVITLYNANAVCDLHKRNNNEYAGMMHFEPMRSVPTITRTGGFYVEQYNSSGQLYATMENSFSNFVISAQWTELRFDITLSTVDPVNYLAVASDNVIFRFDAEIY